MDYLISILADTLKLQLLMLALIATTGCLLGVVGVFIAYFFRCIRKYVASIFMIALIERYIAQLRGRI